MSVRQDLEQVGVGDTARRAGSSLQAPPPSRRPRGMDGRLKGRGGKAARSRPGAVRRADHRGSWAGHGSRARLTCCSSRLARSPHPAVARALEKAFSGEAAPVPRADPGSGERAPPVGPAPGWRVRTAVTGRRRLAGGPACGSRPRRGRADPSAAGRAGPASFPEGQRDPGAMLAREGAAGSAASGSRGRRSWPALPGNPSSPPTPPRPGSLPAGHRGASTSPCCRARAPPSPRPVPKLGKLFNPFRGAAVPGTRTGGGLGAAAPWEVFSKAFPKRR